MPGQFGKMIDNKKITTPSFPRLSGGGSNLRWHIEKRLPLLQQTQDMLKFHHHGERIEGYLSKRTTIMPDPTLNGFNLHYDRAGSGPTVVYVHGGFASLATRLTAPDEYAFVDTAGGQKWIKIAAHGDTATRHLVAGEEQLPRQGGPAELSQSEQRSRHACVPRGCH